MWNTIFECLWGWILLTKMILLAKLTNFWDLINLILLNYIIVKLIILRIDTSIDKTSYRDFNLKLSFYLFEDTI